MARQRLTLCTVLPLLLLAPASISAFDRPSIRAISTASSRYTGFGSPALSPALELRGGQTTTSSGSSGTAPEPSEEVISDSSVAPTVIMTSLSSSAAALSEALRSGPHVSGVGSLFAVAALVVVPLSLIHRSYSFSVGYGASIAAMGLALLKSFGVPILPTASSPPSGHLASVTFLYGLRLTAFLLLREGTVEGKREGTRKFDEGSPLHKRLPLSLSVSVFYAFLVSPAMYALRAETRETSKWLEIFQWAGTALAYAGFVMEAAADQHKFAVKRRHKVPYDREPRKKEFVGPVGGAYALCRHPNYFGHVLFWLGLLLGGASSFGKDAAAWICGALGFYGILSVMRGASKRLDKKQADSYGGQADFEKWRGRVKGSLAPSFLGG